jgi:hypothetical protein
MCSFLYQQRKINEIQEQIASIFGSLKFLCEISEKNRGELEEKINIYTKEVLEIINSESKS